MIFVNAKQKPFLTAIAMLALSALPALSDTSLTWSNNAGKKNVIDGTGSNLHFACSLSSWDEATATAPLRLPNSQHWEVSFQVRINAPMAGSMSVNLMHGQDKVAHMGADATYKAESAFVGQSMPYTRPEDGAWHTFQYIQNNGLLRLRVDGYDVGQRPMTATPDAILIACFQSEIWLRDVGVQTSGGDTAPTTVQNAPTVHTVSTPGASVPAKSVVSMGPGEIMLDGAVSGVKMSAGKLVVSVGLIIMPDGHVNNLASARKKTVLVSSDTRIAHLNSSVPMTLSDLSGENVIVVCQDTGVGVPAPASEVLAFKKGTAAEYTLSLTIPTPDTYGGDTSSTASKSGSTTPYLILPPDNSKVSLADTESWIVDTINRKSAVYDLGGRPNTINNNASFDSEDLNFEQRSLMDLDATTVVDISLPLRKVDFNSVTVTPNRVTPSGNSNFERKLSTATFYTVNCQTISKQQVIESTMVAGAAYTIHGNVATVDFVFADQETAISFAKALRHAIHLIQSSKDTKLF